MAAPKKPRRDEAGRLIQNTTIKVRLYPTEEQAELIDKTFGCCRFLWNRMLAEQEEFYAAAGEHFLPTPARYKKDFPFLKEVDSGALAAVHQNLRRAFQSFFSKPETYRHPVFKKKKDNKNSYKVYRSTTGTNLYLTRDGIRLPKLEVVEAKFHRRPLSGWKLKSATVSKTPTGKYFCALLFEYAVQEPVPVLPEKETTLGLNYSLSHFYVDSNGQLADPPQWLKRSQAKLAEYQRRLSRMEHGSKNYQQQLQRIRLLHERIANQRKDFIHKESRRIANEWDAVCVRDSDLRAMSQKLKLGNVMDSGFGAFRLCLAYKLERQGKPFIVVDGQIPTAKTCHSCGSVHDWLPSNQRTWVCPACGAKLHRAVNAARNLRDGGLAQFYATREAKASA